MGQYRVKKTFLKLAETRTTFNFIFFVFVLISGKTTPLSLSFPVGIVFILAGIYIRTIAAGTIKKNVSLTTTGPYAICRHPLYLGSFLLSSGLMIISHNLYVFLFFIIFFPLTYIPAILKEENFLAEKFGDNYIKYKESTPCFIPSFKKAGIYEFSWEQIKRNREYLNWIIISVLITVLLIKSYYIF